MEAVDEENAKTLANGDILFPVCLSGMVNGAACNIMEPAVDATGADSMQDGTMKCDLLIQSNIQVAGLEPLVNGCDSTATLNHVSSSVKGKGIEGEGCNGINGCTGIEGFHSSSNTNLCRPSQRECRNNFIHKQHVISERSQINITVPLDDHNCDSNDFSIQRNTSQSGESTPHSVDLFGQASCNIETRFENGTGQYLNSDTDRGKNILRYRRKENQSTRPRKKNSDNRQMNGDTHSSDGSVCADDYEDGNIQLYEERYMEDSELQKSDLKPEFQTCDNDSNKLNVESNLSKTQPVGNLAQDNAQHELEDRSNIYYKLYSDYLQQKEKLNTWSKTDEPCTDCMLAPLAVAEDVDSSDCDDFEIAPSLASNMQRHHEDLDACRGPQNETSHPLLFFHNIERPLIHGQERMARLIRSHSPSMESLEDIGDYIDTDFPSHASKLLFQSSSTQSSSSEPSSPDEGCVHGRHDKDAHSNCPMNNNVWQPLQINANCIAAVKPQVKNKVFDLPNAEEKLQKLPEQLLLQPELHVSDSSEQISNRPLAHFQIQPQNGSDLESREHFSKMGSSNSPIVSDVEFSNGSALRKQFANHMLGACAVDANKSFERVDIKESSKQWTSFNDNLYGDHHTCENCMFECFPQTCRIMSHTNDLNIDTQSSKLDDRENTHELSLVPEIQKMSLHFPGANFQNNECNQRKKIFRKYSLEPRSLSSSEGEEENADFSFEMNRLTVLNGHIPQDPLNVTGQYVIQEPENVDNITESLQASTISCPPQCFEENFDTNIDDPVYAEICDMQKRLAEHESVPIAHPLPARFERRKKRGNRCHSDVEKVMIWNEYEAYVLQVKQIGTSACGPTAVMNVLKAFEYQVDKEEVCRTIVTNLRMETVPIPYYLFSRSAAGTTEEALISGISKLTRGTICGRFFHFYPNREVQLLKWLGYWIKKGAVPLATLNLQKGVKTGWSIPDAWHHQMIYGVSSKGVYLTNPLEIVPEETILEQLTSDSVLLVRRQDVVNRFRDWAPLNEIVKQKEEEWRKMNVLGQVVNVLREACSLMTQVPGYRTQLTSHVAIPAAYKAGVTLFIRHNTDGYHELMNTPDLPIRTDETSGVR